MTSKLCRECPVFHDIKVQITKEKGLESKSQLKITNPSPSPSLQNVDSSRTRTRVLPSSEGNSNSNPTRITNLAFKAETIIRKVRKSLFFWL